LVPSSSNCCLHAVLSVLGVRGTRQFFEIQQVRRDGGLSRHNMHVYTDGRPRRGPHWQTFDLTEVRTRRGEDSAIGDLAVGITRPWKNSQKLELAEVIPRRGEYSQREELAEGRTRRSDNSQM
jgi:hypothetical protein